MANTTDYTRLLDGYTLLAIKGWVEGLLSYKAPLASPTFTGTVTLPTSVKIGTSTATGLVKYTNGTLSIDTSSYKTDYRYRPIQVGGTEKIGTTSATALNFVNGTHSVQFTYSSGLYAEVNLANYKPNGNTAFLDSSNKVSTSYLPDTVLGQLEYKGTWDATSTTTSTPQKGWYYICSTAGTRNPDGTTSSVTYNVGDWAVYNGTSWDKVDNTDAITGIVLVSGNAKTGQVTIPAAGTEYGLIKTGYTSSGKNYKVQLDSNGNAYVNVPWTDNNDYYYIDVTYNDIADNKAADIGYIYPVGTPSGPGEYSTLRVNWATATAAGISRVAAVRTTAVTVNSITSTSSRYYGVEMNTDGKLFVNVPWSNTTYSADGTTLSLSGTTFSIKSGYLATVATSGSYNDLSNKPTIPATNVIPATTTANKVLLSTSTSGTAAWSAWSSAGFLKTNASGVVSIDTTSYIPVGGSNAITGDLSPNVAGTASAGVSLGTSSKPWKYIYAYGITSNSFTAKGTNHYAIYGDATIAIGSTSSPYAIITLPNETGTLALVGDNNHTHTLSIASDTGTNQLTLAYGTKYKLTAGGSTFIFTMPTSDNTDHYPTTFTWTNGSTNGPTGSLTGNTGFSAVSFGAIPAASASHSGIVTTGTQSFAGQKSFLGGIVSQDPNIQNLKMTFMPSYFVFEDGTHYLSVNASGLGGNKYVNMNTYSRTEAENILNGLNSDGTSI